MIYWHSVLSNAEEPMINYIENTIELIRKWKSSEVQGNTRDWNVFDVSIAMNLDYLSRLNRRVHFNNLLFFPAHWNIFCWQYLE